MNYFFSNYSKISEEVSNGSKGRDNIKKTISFQGKIRIWKEIEEKEKITRKKN